MQPRGGNEPVALLSPEDPFRVWREIQEADGPNGTPDGSPERTTVDVLAPEVLRALTDLDDPRLVLSEGYVGIDRRRTGVRSVLSRALFGPWRRLLRIDILIVLAVVSVIVGATVLATTRPHSASSHSVLAAAVPVDPLAALPTTAVSPALATTPTAASAPPVASPATTPTAAPVAAAAPPAVAQPVAVNAPTAPPATVAPTTPEAMGAAALGLVRYPWQKLPGYSIQFLPISDAPSPGFYGNTTFAWGKPGGVSTLYVYPGETVDRLAGITAFEIGHEVDASLVEPQGGHDQIIAILGVHPVSWAPECDCAEQGYLSGWYAAAFSDYWSPGVGAWSTLASPPTGATLTAVQPWLDPRIP